MFCAVHARPRRRPQRRMWRPKSDLPRSTSARSGYRFYSPKLGRWVNRDPADEDGGWNLFCALWNSPVILSDPLGDTPIILPVCGEVLIGVTAPAWGPWVLVGATVGYGGYVIYEYVRTGTYEEHWQLFKELYCSCVKDKVDIVPKTLTETKTESLRRTCPPCPPAPDAPPARYDRAPPSTPHFPCPGDHLHFYWYEVNQRPWPDCACFNNLRETVVCAEDY